LVPDELVRGMSLVGPREYIAERLAAFAEAGVTTLLVSPLATDAAESMRFVEDVLQMRTA
jgi:alkanesulfonate monooxygenase SsuD/methylene tetrahydromethanopterin reductase-like flavin-dependent oxidoreductase (luciferase family)